MRDDQYEKLGVDAPEHIPHNFDLNNVDDTLKKLKPRNWRQQGNQLIADTEIGELVNFIPTGHLLIGEENGLPKFKRL